MITSMRKHILHVVCLLALVLSAPAFAQFIFTYPQVNTSAGTGFDDPTVVTSDITGAPTTRGELRRACFEASARPWASYLDVSQPVVISARMIDLGGDASSATLGSAGPNLLQRDFTGAPLANTWFVDAQANQLGGGDQDTSVDIFAQFNSAVDNTGLNDPLGSTTWYYGTNGVVPNTQIDFYSTAMHELGHGLGFLSAISDSGEMSGGTPLIYDRQLIQFGMSPEALVSMNDTQRGEALTSNNLRWNGPEVVSAMGGTVRMYAPGTYDPGSSVSHWDTSLTPNQLMEPFASDPFTQLGLEKQAFADMLWPLTGAEGEGEGEGEGEIELPCPQLLCLTHTQLSYTWQGGSGKFIVTNCKCEPMAWRITDFCTWTNFTSPTSGELEPGESAEVTFDVPMTLLCSGRGCEIVVEATHAVTGRRALGSPGIVAVGQGGLTVPQVCFAPKFQLLPGPGGSAALQIWNYGCVPTNWSISANCDWVTAITPSVSEESLQSGERFPILINFLRNNTCDERTCTLYVDAPGAWGREAIVLTQEPDGYPAAGVSPQDDILADQYGGEFQFVVTNVGCETLDWTVQTSAPWITLNSQPLPLLEGASQTMEGVILASPVCAPRSGTITITQPFFSNIVLNVQQDLGGTPVVKMNPLTRKVNSNGGWTAFELTNANCGTMNWSASTVAPWISSIVPESGALSPGSSTSITAFYENNGDTAERSGVITISAPQSEGDGQTFVLDQGAGAFPVLEVSPSSFSGDGNPGSTTFSVSNTGSGDMDWSIAGTCGWITGVSPTSGTLSGGGGTTVTLSYNRNTTGAPRTCNLSINGNNATGSPAAFALTQESIGQPRLDVSPLTRSVGVDGGSVIYTVRNTGEGTLAFTSDFAAGWIESISPATGSITAGASVSVTVTCAANDSATSRIATITFQGDQPYDGSVPVTLSQAGNESPRLEVSQLELSAGPGAGTQTLVITNGRGGAMDWSIDAECGWITQLTPSEGSLGPGQTATVTVGYVANEGASRTCALTVTAPEGEDSPKMVTLTQASTSLASLSLTPANQSVDSDAGMVNLTLQNTGGSAIAWSAEAGCDWVTAITPESGTLGAGATTNLTVDYSVNSNFASRSCSVTVEAPEVAGSPFTATLNQEGGALPCGCLDIGGKTDTRGRLGDLLFIGAGILAMLAASRMRRS